MNMSTFGHKMMVELGVLLQCASMSSGLVVNGRCMLCSCGIICA